MDRQKLPMFEYRFNYFPGRWQNCFGDDEENAADMPNEEHKQRNTGRAGYLTRNREKVFITIVISHCSYLSASNVLLGRVNARHID